MSVIGIPVVRSAKTYATALHEVGHILGAHQRSRSVMVRERWAWRWAKRNARMWTPTMERSMSSCLAWYEANEKTQQAAHEAAMYRAAESQRGLFERCTTGGARRHLLELLERRFKNSMKSRVFVGCGGRI